MPARLFRSAKADRNRFIALYVSMAVGLLVAAGLFVYEAKIIVADGLRDEEAFSVLGAANRVLHDLENAETGQRGYLLTGDENYLVPYRQGVHDLDDTILRLQQAAGSDEKSLELVRRVEHAKTSKVTELARTVELARSGNRAGAIALVQTNEGKLYMDGLREDLNLLLNNWRDRRKAATQDAHRRLVFGSAALVAIAVLVCCLMVYTVYIQRRAFARVHAYSNALDQQAAHDTLTGLPNRRRLLSAIDELSGHAAGSRRTALLYLDIDGFKNVNDAMGHSAGDVLLRRLAESLRAVTRHDDMLARVGGDEFVLLADDCGDDSQLRELAERLVSSVRAVGEREYGGRFAIGVSIGIATFPDRVRSIAGLLDVADAAMYAAKRSGRSTYSFGASRAAGVSNVIRMTR
ncbi:diguanylate cyclase domain-containing protein [Paraburkholderia phenoliruptrix]|uniref:diguanylate cyclase domain-containing protein n=1 Tax=Paraburkholderia phenoliruptrix TaxID=252970 RepID=UPI00286990F4|nr:diguanylate cyclase [Paraburkholderia phenoliruptrix]WMY11392.1 diguanylate cyclase [Paraburkholderia phenoliruptrix]